VVKTVNIWEDAFNCRVASPKRFLQVLAGLNAILFDNSGVLTDNIIVRGNYFGCCWRHL
jgi:hypothetical protein